MQLLNEDELRMKDLLKEIFIYRWFNNTRELLHWRKRQFLGHSPQFVKQNLFKKYGISNAIWVETGTYRGTTTCFLAKRYPYIYSIEPSKMLYERALKIFKNQNVSLFNDVSENVFPKLLKKLNGNMNFWLDGHYSESITFQGKKDCPVEDELRAIEENLENFSSLTIMIDDVRDFLLTNTDYPSIDYLVNWGRRLGFQWQIEHDIFIMRRTQEK